MSEKMFGWCMFFMIITVVGLVVIGSFKELQTDYRWYEGVVEIVEPNTGSFWDGCINGNDNLWVRLPDGRRISQCTAGKVGDTLTIRVIGPHPD